MAEPNERPARERPAGKGPARERPAGEGPAGASWPDGLEAYSADADGVRHLPPAALPRVAGALVERGARLVMVVGLDLSGLDGAPVGVGGSGLPAHPLGARSDGSGLAVEVVLGLPGGELARLRAAVPADEPAYPSLTPILPAAQWDEREIHDLFGIEPAGHPDLRPLVLHDVAGLPAHPFRKRRPAGPGAGPGAEPGAAPADQPPLARPFRPFVAHGEGVYQLPVGPIHAGVIEPGHFRFSAVGESVLYLDARLFYTHRGLEQLVEGRSFERALPIVERACGVCTVTHALAYSRAVERLTGTTVPPRARFARVLLAELERLYNHVGDLGNICAGVGFHFGTSQLGWQKERLLRVNEALTGHRYLTGLVAPGGLRADLSDPVLAELGATVDEIAHDVRGLVRALRRSEGLMSRLHGTGIVSRELAERLGAVGVAARASGLTRDLRLDRPYEAYPELDLPLVTMTAGDVAARFHVRAQELAASAAIVRDLAGRLPAGPWREPLAKSAPAGASTVVGVEGPRGASWLWLMAGPEGTIERLHLRSASFANWPLVAAAVPGNLVPDFPLINKSFELCYACTDR